MFVLKTFMLKLKVSFIFMTVMKFRQHTIQVKNGSPNPIGNQPFFFFFNDTETTEIYTLSLHDALPISRGLLDRKTPLLVSFNVKMGYPGIPFIEKILFPCARKLGGTYLHTSADHSHLNLSVRKSETASNLP